MTLQEEVRVSVLCGSEGHPVYGRVVEWGGYDELVTSSRELSGGELLFLVSCSEIIGPEVRARYDHVLVLHAGDLPQGRGWSPHIWDVLEGRDALTVTLLEAVDRVDSGDIWAKRRIPLQGVELADELNSMLFDAEIELIEWAIANWRSARPRPQHGPASLRRRRTPSDSELDPDRTIAEQFDLLRVADPVRYPAYFSYRGRSYNVKLERRD